MIAGCVAAPDTPDEPDPRAPGRDTVQLPDGHLISVTGVRRGDYLVVGDMLFPLDRGGPRAARVQPTQRWPSRHIPYLFSSGVDATTRQRVLAGMEPWKALGFSFDLQPENTSQPFVSIQPSGDPFSSNATVGYAGFASIYQAGASCTPHDYAHEWGHVLGLFHEHERADRDSYIEVFPDVDPSLDASRTIDHRGGDGHGPYDFDSIMHYDAYGRTSNVINTNLVRIRPRDGRALSSFGFATQPSAGDAAALDFLYGPRPPVPVPLYQLYNPQLQDWFYTIDASQRAIAMASYSYLDYGVAARVEPVPYGGALAFRRTYKGPPQTDHFYTTSLDEFTSAMVQGWADEGAEGYVYPNPAMCPDCVPLYRFSHFDGAVGDLIHFYTVNGSFRPLLEAQFWTFEGAAGYVHAP